MPESIDRPYQIICEGKDDCAFFSRLVRNRHLEGFQVGGDHGKDLFHLRIAHIQNFATVPIRGYVIIADNDDDPADRFDNACKQLRKMKLPVPPFPYQIQTGTDGTRTAVLTIPDENVEGGLETLLISCCDGLTQHAACIDQFCACVMTPRRKIDADKLRLRATIASYQLDDPSVSILFWVGEERRPFEMTHTALNRIADFLATFAL